MNESKFWDYFKMILHSPIEQIEQQGYFQLQNKLIAERLTIEGVEVIHEFHKALCEKISQLYMPKIGQLFLLTAYDLSKEVNRRLKPISTDGFIDFRAWIVSLGRKYYYAFLNFDSEENIPQVDMDANRAENEELVYLPLKIIRELGEEVKLDFHLDKDVKEMYSKMNCDMC